jgi:hypothetical protein
MSIVLIFYNKTKMAFALGYYLLFYDYIDISSSTSYCTVCGDVPQRPEPLLSGADIQPIALH